MYFAFFYKMRLFSLFKIRMIVCGKCGRLLVLDNELCDGGYNCVFSDFVFKIRLIRLGFSLKKTPKNSCIWTHNLQILSKES